MGPDLELSCIIVSSRNLEIFGSSIAGVFGDSCQYRGYWYVARSRYSCTAVLPQVQLYSCTSY
jgi:hypothetical protein